MSRPTCEPGQRLLEEQDYVQAYENVREKYKGKSSPAPHFLTVTKTHFFHTKFDPDTLTQVLEVV